MGNSCTSCWYNRISVVEHWLVIIFRKWGYFVAAHPLPVITGSLLLTIIMCIGMLFIESENDTLELYVPKDSISYSNYQRYSKTWERYQDNINFQSIQVTAADNNDLKSQINLFTVEYLNELLRIHNLIMDIEVQYKGNTYQFDDICYRYKNENCAASSILEFYDFNETLINNAFDGNNPLLYPSQFSSYSEKNIFMVLILGQNITLNEMNHVIATPAYSIDYLTDDTLFDDELILEWEHKFQSLINKEKNTNSFFYLTYQTKNSFNEELSRSVGSDIPSFVISFILIGVFASFILMRFKKNTDAATDAICKYKIDPLRNRSQLSIMGIISTICAIFGSFGIVGGLFQIKWNPVVAVSPFLLVGLGVDDMFVLLRAYELTNPNDSIGNRIALTMERGGISILFTSITDLVAFCVGSTSSFGSVSAFCLYCGVGVFMDFLFQITFFLGMMVYDSRPNTCCICCVCGSNNKQKEQEEEVHEKTTDLETANNIDLNDTNILLSYMINTEASSNFMKKLGDLILSNTLTKILIIILFICYLIGATIGITKLHAYQDPVDLVPIDSYLTEFLNLYEIYFDQIGQPVNIIFDKHLDYSNENIFNRINSLVIELRKDKCFESEIYLTSSWIHSFRFYLENNYGNINDINSTLFYEILYLEYLMTEEGE
eukprot:72496_1